MNTKAMIYLLGVLVVCTGCSQREVDNDKLVERGGVQYVVNEEEPFTGMAIEKYKSGQFHFKAEYNEGLEDGVYEEWTKNGQRIKKGEYAKGKQYGLFSVWNEEGQLISTAEFKDGKKHGEMKEYQTDEKVKNVWNYENDIIVRYKGYDEDSSLKEEMFYNEGLPHGEQFHAPKEGGEVRCVYANGKLASFDIAVPKLLNGKGTIVDSELQPDAFMESVTEKKVLRYRLDEKGEIESVVTNREGKVLATEDTKGLILEIGSMLCKKYFKVGL